MLVPRILRPELVQDLLGLPGDFDRVGARLFADEKADAFLPVEPGQALAFLDGVHDPGDVLEVGRPPSFGRFQVDLADFLERFELADDPDGVLENALADRPALEIPVEGVDPGRDVVDRHAVERQPSRVDLDLDLALDAAGDLGRGDALDLLEAGLDQLLGEGLELQQIAPRPKGPGP